MGTITAVEAVISITETIPVTGARTLALKKQDIPTMAKGTTRSPHFQGDTASARRANSTLHSSLRRSSERRVPDHRRRVGQRPEDEPGQQERRERDEAEMGAVEQRLGQMIAPPDGFLDRHHQLR